MMVTIQLSLPPPAACLSQPEPVRSAAGAEQSGQERTWAVTNIT